MDMLSLQLSQFGLAFLTDASNDGIPTSVSMGQDSCSATLGLQSVNFAGSDILETLNRMFSIFPFSVTQTQTSYTQTPQAHKTNGSRFLILREVASDVFLREIL